MRHGPPRVGSHPSRPTARRPALLRVRVPPTVSRWAPSAPPGLAASPAGAALTGHDPTGDTALEEMPGAPHVEIEYCAGCGWLLRAAWLAQELLTTFAEDLGAVTLKPSTQPGTFRITVAGAQLWCRKQDGGFPQAAELKRRLRDQAFPERTLGHSESRGAQG